MKKLLILGAALVLLTACSSQKTTESGDGANQPGQSSSQTEPGGFQEITVVDNDRCAIRITGIQTSGVHNCILQVYLENKSPDTTYMMTVSTAAVNGVQTDPFFATEVAPGKKANQQIIFPDTFPEDIGSYSDIEGQFLVYDSNDWSALPVAEASFRVYPSGQGNVRQYTRKARDSDVVLADNDSITVLVTGYREDKVWGYTADLFLCNKTGRPLMVTVEDASINGFMADPFFAVELSGGRSAFSSMSWTDSVLQENGIEKIEKVEFTLRVYPADDYLAEDLLSQQVTLTP